MTPSQRAFLEDEFFQLTLGAAMQRGGVYRPKLTERERRPVHTTLRELLETLLPEYVGGGMGDEAHLTNIERLAQTVTTRHAGVLEGGRFRIGNAQKALNLHPKYRWCVSVSGIARPPHCPFDYLRAARDPRLAYPRVDGDQFDRGLRRPRHGRASCGG